MKKKEELSGASIEALRAEAANDLKETRRLIKELTKDHKEAIKRMKEQEKMIGGISRSNGEFCEEYFINSFKENPTFMDEKYDRVLPYLYPDPAIIDDEYNLVLRNGKTIVFIEMKYKTGINDVEKMFSKLHSYRTNYLMFKDYKIYLCLASFRFPERVRERAEKERIVLIQQKGEKIEVMSENVRTW